MKRPLYRILTTLSLLLGIPSSCFAIDSASLAVATGNHTRLVRAGLQWKFYNQDLTPNVRGLNAYWDLNLSQWRGNRYQDIADAHQNITSIGITPVLRFQTGLGGLYVEGGVGAHFLSKLYDNAGRHFSTSLQFGSKLGLGYALQNNWDIGISIQHYSNAGIKKPNSGINLAELRLMYRFK